MDRFLNEQNLTRLRKLASKMTSTAELIGRRPDLLQEWPVSARVNRSGVGNDDDPTVTDPV